MTVIARFYAMQDFIPALAWNQLVSLVPSAQKRTVFEIDVSHDSQLFREILSIVANFGLIENEPLRHGYRLSLRRHYDESDKVNAELLDFAAERFGSSMNERDEQGRAIINTRELDATLAAGCYGSRGMIVSREFRRKIEGAGLKGFKFSPVVFFNDHKDMEPRVDSEGRFWEVQAEKTLPPHLYPNEYGCMGGQPFDGDYSKVIGIGQSPYMGFEFHFRRLDVAAIGEFDVAQTMERLVQRQPNLIGSQRWYQFCRAEKVPMFWTPVRLHD